MVRLSATAIRCLPSEPTMYNQRILSVTQVARYLRQLLDYDEALSDVWISGEVSNFTRSQAGHLYFTLKDQDAQLRCVFFRRGAPRLPFGNGDAVLAHGRVSFYDAAGALQLYVDLVQPAGGGVVARAVEEVPGRP